MKYEIMEQRLNSVLERDKCSDPQRICEVLKGELAPIISNYIDPLDIVVRFRKFGEKLTFDIEINTNRLKPFGYLPKMF